MIFGNLKDHFIFTSRRTAETMSTKPDAPIAAQAEMKKLIGDIDKIGSAVDVMLSELSQSMETKADNCEARALQTATIMQQLQAKARRMADLCSKSTQNLLILAQTYELARMISASSDNGDAGEGAGEGAGDDDYDYTRSQV